MSGRHSSGTDEHYREVCAICKGERMKPCEMCVHHGNVRNVSILVYMIAVGDGDGGYERQSSVEVSAQLQACILCNWLRMAVWPGRIRATGTCVSHGNTKL